MDPELKQRVVGAAVLVALGVVFIPALLDDTAPGPEQLIPFEADPAPPENFNSRVVPLDDATMEKLEKAMDATPDEIAGGREWSENARDETSPAAATEQAESIPETPQSTAAAAPPRTGVTAWVVQLGSFNNEKNAKSLVTRLQQAGYTAFIQPAGDGAKRSYRVRVGPELDRETAEKTREKLAGEIDLKGLVLRYP